MIASIPLLLWHQTEEWVLPGGFLNWFNRSVWESESDEFPITRGLAFRINVGAGWGVSAVAAILLRGFPPVAGGLLSSHVANAGLHLGRAVVEKRYNPGLATAPLMGLVGAGGVARLISERPADRRPIVGGAGVGLALSAALPLALARRANAARR